MRSFSLWVLLAIGGLSLACAGGGDVLGDDEDEDGFPADQDCDDDDDDVNPDEDEVCDDDDVDEDCDGFADNEDLDLDPEESDAIEAWRDLDGDGYGDPDASRFLCELIEGYVTDASDCGDNDPAVSPSGQEVCDFLDADEDCDGLVDDSDLDVDVTTLQTLYPDADGDGYGDASMPVLLCDGRDGYTFDGTDCDDDDATIYPNALDTWYDGVDADCAGDDDYDRDADGHTSDDYGGDDCDDQAAGTYEGASDTAYDGVDADCAGDSDYDRDADGHDAEAYGGDDCDDTDADTYYGAWEAGTEDNNCDGVARATPQAVASYDAGASSLDVCNTVYLDGTGSADPGGGVLTYEWELVAVPSGGPETTDDIVEYDDAEPTFVPTLAGDYSFALVVSNTSAVDSTPDTLTVTIADRSTNSAPSADAGADQTESETATCTIEDYTTETCEDCADVVFVLDAGSSSDPDGDALTYTWAVTSGTGTLSGTSGETTTLTIAGSAATSGTTARTAVVVTVTATDCAGETDTDTVTLTAECTGS